MLLNEVRICVHLLSLCLFGFRLLVIRIDYVAINDLNTLLSYSLLFVCDIFNIIYGTSTRLTNTVLESSLKFFITILYTVLLIYLLIR